MKTQIITLENHDDLISVRDRMSWAKSPRILLVWPKFERVTLRPVDLRVLQSHARILGAELGLVTRIPNVKRNALGFGIPVFETTAEAQREPWPPRQGRASVLNLRKAKPNLRQMKEQSKVEEAKWRSNSAVRVGFFALGVVAVLAVAILFLPRATIELSPVSQQQSITIPVSANPDTESIFISGSVPAHSLSVLVTDTQTMTVTSQGVVPNDKAEGIARFTNLTQTDLTIPAGTVIYTLGPPSVRFQTVNITHLPGGSKKFVEVPIVAVEAGSAGNVAAGAIQAIDGSLALSASVTNPNPTAGGTDLTATEAADADRQHLHDLVMSTLDQHAKQEIISSIEPQDLLLLNTLVAGTPSQEIYDPPAGQPGDTLKLTLSVQYSAQYVTADDLTRLAQTVLDTSMPAGFVPKPDTLQFSSTNVFTADPSGTTHFNLLTQRTVLREIQPQQVIFLVRGLTPTAAKQALHSHFLLAAPPEVEMSPSWWPWMPLIPFRIAVR
ncbi:MAG TPA: baseplate J/gp47 family protein [Anaerolineales bacterium]|nr:baseplate J/gp47 family protein [Anaerolineales bacterium]